MWAVFVLLLVAVAQGPTSTSAEIQHEVADMLVEEGTLDNHIEADLDLDRKKRPKPGKKKPAKKPATGGGTVPKPVKPSKKPGKKKPGKKKPGKKKPGKKPKPSTGNGSGNSTVPNPVKPGKKPAKKPGKKKPGKKPAKKPGKKPGKKPSKKPSGKPGSSNVTGTVTGHGYRQAWLLGDPTTSSYEEHPHEGLRLEDGSGWVSIGHTLNKPISVIVRRIDNNGAPVWARKLAKSGSTSSKKTYSVGFSIAQSGNKLIIGVGLWKKSSMKPAVLALDTATGAVLWTKVMDSAPKHGGVRGLIVDGGRIICTGYFNSPQTGFLFVADEALAAVWELDMDGNLVKEKVLSIEGLGQGAKIRKDKSGRYVMASTGWGEAGGKDVFVVVVVKLSSSLEVVWTRRFGLAGGHSQMFDILVDREGDYLVGGHTTVGYGVVNWDYLALKINSVTGGEVWRKTFGQPRGFDARYVHDECYGVALDPSGNYLVLGGSGDEYKYEAKNSDGWSSGTWVSYLVKIDTKGNTLFEGVFGDKEGNNAGEYLSVDSNTGEVMIFVDSDTVKGSGFLKLNPN